MFWRDATGVETQALFVGRPRSLRPSDPGSAGHDRVRRSWRCCLSLRTTNATAASSSRFRRPSSLKDLGGHISGPTIVYSRTSRFRNDGEVGIHSGKYRGKRRECRLPRYLLRSVVSELTADDAAAADGAVHVT